MCVNWLGTRERLIKGWDKKLIKYKKLSKVSSKSSSEKIRKDAKW